MVYVGLKATYPATGDTSCTLNIGNCRKVDIVTTAIDTITFDILGYNRVLPYTEVKATVTVRVTDCPGTEIVNVANTSPLAYIYSKTAISAT